MKIQGSLKVLGLVHQLTDGIAALSLGKRVSSSGFHLSVAGLFGVCALILAVREGKFGYFDFLPRSDDREGSLENWVVPGLQNFGNNCFLNVILQALASCSHLRKFLETIVEECECALGEEWADCLPLTAALASLMEDLCNVRHQRMTLSPRKLMNMMDRYISGFNLASQQDAEEALLHILSLLREEVTSLCAPVCSPLADVSAIPNRRILSSTMPLENTEHERWKKFFLGPFDGIVGSSLTCESCSFQISLDFQFFHSLHLSPVLYSGAAAVVPGCSLEDCLRHFFVAEQLTNYCCSHCWHMAAVKYLSLMDEDKAGIERLRHCLEQDSCSCKHLPGVRVMPWSNSFSHTSKQLSMASSPKILCIHLQRVSMDAFGDLVKLEGHISFPFTLNLKPFMKNRLGVKNSGETLQSVQAMRQLQCRPHTNSISSHLNTSMLDGVCGQYGQVFQKGPTPTCTGDCFNDVFGLSSTQSDKVEGDYLYQLVSVVEHFGIAGSGHYTVYRRVEVKDDGVTTVGDSVQWFCISDSEVRSVSEGDVLATEASLLFYEKVSENIEIC